MVYKWSKVVKWSISRVLPKTTILKIKLVYSAHSIPFCAYNELLKGFFDWISRSVCPLMIYVFSNFEKYKYQIVLCQ